MSLLRPNVLFAAVSVGVSSFLGGHFLQNPEKYSQFKCALPFSTCDNEHFFNGHKKSRWDSNWDRRHENDSAPRAVRNLYLIRHGQYNLDGKEDSDRYLTGLGRKQAVITGQRLKSLNIDFTSLISSTMTRARETADLINNEFGESFDVKRHEILVEGPCFPPEPPSSNWKPDKTFHEDAPRVEAAFRRFFHRAESHQESSSHELIVCHANVIRYFICRSLQIPPDAWLRFSLAHASITHISIYPDGNVAVRAVGNSGHFPPDHVTTR